VKIKSEEIDEKNEEVYKVLCAAEPAKFRHE